ncbi:thiosulfate oxidation carrier complex protein SoxZ [Azoarcus sp. KH32C]|uniref:thiosulfate oxidation carrier complex protein SoxZ n=1 Tax=Azoarcus sp. KH32C TaxID=748247 RepID=UPI0002386258|nr:thiosulfate oxidation carrier complex protein SoxZ [Azoarcus sp. KH32C]BAL23557.1 phosphodiesterase I [Azoarcus sp. KH32C]
MTAPTRIRATLRDGLTEVRLLMTHPMENGLRKDAEGTRIPAHFITDVEVRHGERVVLAANFGPSVSANPYLAFRFSGGAAGDEISVAWRDNLGASRVDAARIA